MEPPLDDFRSQAEQGRVYDDAEVQRRAEEVSVWDSLERAARLGRKRPRLAYVAVLDVPADVPLRPGKRGHWGIPKEFSADEIRRWIADVVALPSGAESPR